MSDTAKLPINEILDVIDLGLAIGQDVKESFDDDGKLTGSDFIHFKETALAVIPAIQGAENIIPQLKDFTSDELLQVQEHIVRKLPDIGERWIRVAENAMKAGYHLWMVVKDIRGV